MNSWGDRVGELVAGSYLDALSLLDTVDVGVVPNEVEKVFISTSSAPTSCRFNAMPSSNHCMRSRYSRTGSTTKRSMYLSNSVPIHQRLSRFTPSPLPAGFLPLRRIRVSCLVFQGKKHQRSPDQNLRKGQRRGRNRRRLKAGTNQLRFRCQLFQYRVLPLRSEVTFNLVRQTAKDDDTASIASRRNVRRRVTMDIFEEFGVSSAIINSSAPTPTPSIDVSTQLSPGMLGIRPVCHSDTPQPISSGPSMHCVGI